MTEFSSYVCPICFGKSYSSLGDLLSLHSYQSCSMNVDPSVFEASYQALAALNECNWGKFVSLQRDASSLLDHEFPARSPQRGFGVLLREISLILQGRIGQKETTQELPLLNAAELLRIDGMDTVWESFAYYLAGLQANWAGRNKESMDYLQIAVQTAKNCSQEVTLGRLFASALQAVQYTEQPTDDLPAQPPVTGLTTLAIMAVRCQRAFAGISAGSCDSQASGALLAAEHRRYAEAPWSAPPAKDLMFSDFSLQAVSICLRSYFLILFGRYEPAYDTLTRVINNIKAESLLSKARNDEGRAVEILLTALSARSYELYGHVQNVMLDARLAPKGGPITRASATAALEKAVSSYVKLEKLLPGDSGQWLLDLVDGGRNPRLRASLLPIIPNGLLASPRTLMPLLLPMLGLSAQRCSRALVKSTEPVTASDLPEQPLCSEALAVSILGSIKTDTHTETTTHRPPPLSAAPERGCCLPPPTAVRSASFQSLYPGIAQTPIVESKQDDPPALMKVAQSAYRSAVHESDADTPHTESMSMSESLSIPFSQFQAAQISRKNASPRIEATELARQMYGTYVNPAAPMPRSQYFYTSQRSSGPQYGASATGSARATDSAVSICLEDPYGELPVYEDGLPVRLSSSSRFAV